MKKIYLAAITVLLATSAFSQVNWGVQVTSTMSTASFTSDEGMSYKKSPVAGFGVAVSAQLPLSENLSLRSSLGLLQKGVTVKTNSTDDGGLGKIEGKFTNKMYYAELPVNFTFSKQISDAKLFVGAGPSIGYGLFGKSKGSYTVSVPGMPSQTETVSAGIFDSEDGGYKRLDFSASFIAGVQFNSGVYVNAGYLLGLANDLPKEAEGTYKNRGLQLTIGMFLKK